MKRYIATLELDNDEEIIDASVSYVYRSNGTNYSTTESVEFKEESEKTYEDGLNEAWELAKKIEAPTAEGGLSGQELALIFKDGAQLYKVFKNYSARQAVTRIKEYEEEQKKAAEIKIGDEVHTIYDDTPMVVVNIFNEDVTGEKRVVSVSISGIVSTRYVEELEKTGRHFPQIEEVLQKMQEGNE